MDNMLASLGKEVIDISFEDQPFIRMRRAPTDKPFTGYAVLSEVLSETLVVIDGVQKTDLVMRKLGLVPMGDFMDGLTQKSMFELLPHPQFFYWLDQVNFAEVTEMVEKIGTLRTAS